MGAMTGVADLDGLLLLAILMLGMALGALLTAIWQKTTITRVIREQLEARAPEKEKTDSAKPDAA
jgi:hypothetical protein